jgi:iron(III) transport system substrate-binding protein
MKRSLLSRLLLAVASGSMLALGVATAAEVNVYSARKEELIKPLLDRFSEQYGVEVNLVTGKADALLKRLTSEGRNSPADLLITTDAGRLHRAREAGVLQAVESDELRKAVPPHYRDPDGYWYGLSVRARTILYVRERVDPASISSYADLTAAEWKGRICIRSSSNIYNQSLVASMIAHDGEAAAEEWARGLVANLALPPKGGDRDQIKAAAAGQCDLAVVNTYYYAMMLADGDEAQRAAAEKMAVLWPDRSGHGVHVNVSGAGVTASAPNRDLAIKLLSFLTTSESQAWYAETNHEYPVRDGVSNSKLLDGWGTFRGDRLNLSLLGIHNPAAVRVMDRAGWR